MRVVMRVNDDEYSIEAHEGEAAGEVAEGASVRVWPPLQAEDETDPYLVLYEGEYTPVDIAVGSCLKDVRSVVLRRIGYPDESHRDFLLFDEKGAALDMAKSAADCGVARVRWKDCYYVLLRRRFPWEEGVE